jgi:general L-amino acid transport system substrate-binding protein
LADLGSKRFKVEKLILMKGTITGSILAATAFLALGAQVQAATLDDVMTAGELRCGVGDGLSGFSQRDSVGNWSGFDVDICRAVAAAVLGDSNAVEFVPLSAAARFTALLSSEIDLLARNTVWTATREVSLGLNFIAPIFHDGQGFLVKKETSINRLSQLDGSTICIHPGSSAELNLADYFRSSGMSYKSVTFDTFEASIRGFNSNRCNVLTHQISKLAGLRTRLGAPESAQLLSKTISNEPLGPVVRQGDVEWFNVVRWVLFGQINAEEYDITSNNIDSMLASENLSVQRILGSNGNMAEILSLRDDFMVDVISQVGNYGEMFERNLGPDTPVGLQRGTNALWTDGGILYAPPFR